MGEIEQRDLWTATAIRGRSGESARRGERVLTWTESSTGEDASDTRRRAGHGGELQRIDGELVN